MALAPSTLEDGTAYDRFHDRRLRARSDARRAAEGVAGADVQAVSDDVPRVRDPGGMAAAAVPVLQVPPQLPGRAGGVPRGDRRDRGDRVAARRGAARGPQDERGAG